MKNGKLTPAEVKEIARKSAVNPEERPFCYENGTLTIRAKLNVNDVYGFIIKN